MPLLILPFMYRRWLTASHLWEWDSLEDLSTFAFPMAHLGTLTPTPVFLGVGTRDTNCPIDMGMQHYRLLSDPKEYAIVDADHYELMGPAREILHPKEVAFLKKWLSL